MLNKEAKIAIGAVVESYVDKHPKEARDFYDMMKMRRGTTRDSFASVENADMVERKIAELPETLALMLKFSLLEYDYKWLFSKKGIVWFVKKFPIFAASDRV